MPHHQQLYTAAVQDYKQHLKSNNQKTFFITGDPSNRKALLSLAPLSQAIHESGGDVYVLFHTDGIKTTEVLHDLWNGYEQMKHGGNDQKSKALKAWLTFLKRKGNFERLFIRPDNILHAESNGFAGTIQLPYHEEWFISYQEQKLKETCSMIWQRVFKLKKERVQIAFELMPTPSFLHSPMQDYLDNFIIASMMQQTATAAKEISMGGDTPRASMRDEGNAIGELLATIKGCEMSIWSKEKVFQLYSKVSAAFRLAWFASASTDLTFGIYGKGYGGKHLFGEAFGYPIPKSKMRWSSPGEMIFKFDWAPQTKGDPRLPQSRLGFTETLPIDVLIQSCNIDYENMRMRNIKLDAAMSKAEQIIVKGKGTDLIVHLNNGKGKKRLPKKSDSDASTKLHPHFKKEGIKAGMMANIPSGEVFLTPEYLEGTFTGDIVIAIDQSYRLSHDDPVKVICNKTGYKITQAPKKILSLIKKHKAECWQRLLDLEKKKSLPQKLINLSKKNFENIGEFAINTNPKATLCDYLIVNEKIAGMMHIALGSGFDPDRDTEYHMDIVIDCMHQKMDIYGLDKQGKKVWIMQQGKSCLW
ncbi:hypothetical protein HZB02_02020 [Candidatus Woesearchaeota archaeon]|nr:hypothetical protein [Candidatus Woesearchaeota archaeon]